LFDYVIGDIQGCYEPLKRLLDHINFDPQADRLWFVGDLVNRGPESLEVLRFIRELPVTPRVVLGNHDLHFLSQLWSPNPVARPRDTLFDLLNAHDAEDLGQWLRQQPVLYYDADLKVMMSHAGIAPFWDRMQAELYARELEQAIQGEDYKYFLTHLYEIEPAEHWDPALTGMHRLQVIDNYFTRMRCCNINMDLDLSYSAGLETLPQGSIPWYEVPNRIQLDVDLVFGHWSALRGICPVANIHALDTGCLWGGPLTALRLQDKKRYSVPGL